MKFNQYIKYLIPIVLAAFLVLTCSNRNHKYPGKEYMPEMIHSLAYETYNKVHKNEAFPKGQTALVPPEGTIPVNGHVYNFPNTPEAYQEAALSNFNPIKATDENIARGKEIFTVHCTPCHGGSGDGQGSAVIGSDYKLAAPPINFAQPQPGYLTDGRMFFTITHGKGLMGSYASQVSYEDRWKVIHYIHTLNKSTPAAEPTNGEETASVN